MAGFHRIQDDESAQLIHSGPRFSVYRVDRVDRVGGEADGRVIAKTPQAQGAASDAAALRHEHGLLLELQGRRCAPRPLGLETHDRKPVLILEDVGPGTLRDRCRGGPLALDDFFAAAIGVAEGLAEIHEAGIIHRDVSAANVVVGYDEVTATLVDFDLATKVVGAGHIAEPGALAGSLAFIAPEQTGRAGRLVDHRADLYALGATLYELLTGGPPFAETSARELIHRHLAERPVAPSTVNPAVPPALGAIALKLLAKAPEERYQFAASVAGDLRRAWADWWRRGRVEPFELGSEDLARALPFPDALYGRGRERDALRRALSRVDAGASEVHLITGPAGVGKTKLAASIREDVEARGGLYLRGAFASERHRPHAGLMDAFSDALRRVGGERGDRRDDLRQRIETALGERASLLVEAIPALAELLEVRPAGERRPVPPESERGFHIAVEEFVSAAFQDAPLYLFLDDVDEADPGSLALLRSLLAGPGRRGWLVVGAARQGQRPELEAVLADIERAGTAVRVRDLGGLEAEAVSAFLSEAMQMTPEQTTALARVVVDKTGGNPFFMRHFLRALLRQGWLAYDRGGGRWTWELEAIERWDVTENVAELLAARLGELPSRAFTLVQIASCLGRAFSLGWLASAAEADAEEVAASLAPARRRGLIRARAEDVRSQGATYQFAHAHIRDAARATMDEVTRRRLHRRAARRLLDELSQGELEAELFDIVDQLNLGGDDFADEAERLEAAELNLRAGRKAKTSDVVAAAGYLLRGVELCREAWWSTNFDLVFTLHRDAAAASYFAGEVARADALMERALARAHHVEDRAELLRARTAGAAARGDWREAIERGGEGLGLLGDTLPSRDDHAAADTEDRAVRLRLGQRWPLELLPFPPLEAGEDRARLKLLSELLPPAYFSGQLPVAWVISRMARLTLERGVARESAEALSGYGALLATSGEIELGSEFGKLGMALAAESGDDHVECRVLQMFGMHLQHLAGPIKGAFSVLERAIAAGKRAGSVVFVNFARIGLALSRLSAGAPLARVAEDVESGLNFGRRLHLDVEMLVAVRQVVRALQGYTEAPTKFDQSGFSEAEFLAGLENHQSGVAVYSTLRMMVAYLLGDAESAVAMAREAGARVDQLRRVVLGADYHLYAALALAATAPVGNADARGSVQEGLEEIEGHQRALEHLAAHCGENFESKKLLVLGERERLAGRLLGAAARYEEAIAAAARGELLHEEALANELAGRIYRDLGLSTSARRALRAAASLYASWGAATKVHALAREFPDIAYSDEGPVGFSEGGGAEQDLLTILEASAALAGEVDAERILDRVVRVCVELAGAERGRLFLAEEGGLFLRAAGSAGEPVEARRIRLDECQEAPRPIVEAARDRAQAQVVDDARADPKVQSDPYVRERAVRSALAIPLSHRGEVAGVFYFENDLEVGVFAFARASVIEALGAQALSALEVGGLVERLSAEVQERRRAESMVRMLARAGAAFGESLDHATTINRIAGEVVPDFADVCVVDLAGEDGGLERVAAIHAEPEKTALLRDLDAHETADGGPPPLGRVFDTGAPVFIPEVTEERIARDGISERHAALLRALGLRSSIIAPLVVGGAVRGRLCLGRVSAGRAYTEADVRLAEEVARRASVAIENAQLYGEAQRAVQARDEFLSIASHELKTPLASLKLGIQGLLSGDIAPTPDNISRVFGVAERQVGRLARLIDELLSVARMNKGELELELEAVDLRDVVSEALERLEPELARSGSRVDLRAEAPVRGSWDRSSVDQIATNLISNAIKFGRGEPIEVVIESAREGARLVVEDHGIGISAERQDQVFERFARDVSIREYGGLGLGLYIVRRLVEALSGSLELESAPGEGTRLTVTLPRDPSEASQVAS